MARAIPQASQASNTSCVIPKTSFSSLQLVSYRRRPPEKIASPKPHAIFHCALNGSLLALRERSQRSRSNSWRHAVSAWQSSVCRCKFLSFASCAANYRGPFVVAFPARKKGSCLGQPHHHRNLLQTHLIFGVHVRLCCCARWGPHLLQVANITVEGSLLVLRLPWRRPPLRPILHSTARLFDCGWPETVNSLDRQCWPMLFGFV